MRVIGFLVLSIAAAAVAVIGYAFATGLDARGTPGVIETSVMRVVRRWSIPAEVRTRVNPASPDAAGVHDAMAHFADHCASCHGSDGKGNTEVGRGLYPKPPDMRLPATQQLTDGEIFYVIEHGIRFTGMPAFGNGSAEGERASWNLVRLVRRMPSLTTEQIDEMNGMTPRPPADIRREVEEERFLEGGH